MTKHRRLTTIAMVLLSLYAGASFAQSQDNNNNQVNRAQAVESARKAVDGRVLKVDQDPTKFRVKVLKKNGRVVSVDVDRNSGKVKANKGNKQNKKDNNH